MSEGFLSRWARLKRTGPAEPAAAPAPPEALGEPALAPEELEARLAGLPALDDIGAETDVTRFLETWVPKALRDAALRKAWTSDPRIASFVEVADFQWNWNVPGGAPGCGPLEPGFDAVAHIERLFRDAHAPFLESGQDHGRDVASQLCHDRTDAAMQQEAEPPSLEPDLEGLEPPPSALETPVRAADEGDGEHGAPQHGAALPVPARARRHGGALPS